MEQLMTVEEVAERLVVSPKAVRNWVAARKLRSVKVGRLLRFRERDVEVFLCLSGEEEPPLTTQEAAESAAAWKDYLAHPDQFVTVKDLRRRRQRALRAAG